MEVIKHLITHKRPDKFKIYPLGDMHLGSVDCAEKDLEDIITQIKTERNSYWVGMGDYADLITKNDKRFSMDCLRSYDLRLKYCIFEVRSKNHLLEICNKAGLCPEENC